MPITSDDLRTLGDQLVKLIPTARVIPFKAGILKDWEIAEQVCHLNAGHWALENPGDEVVRGWMLFDWRSWAGVIRFSAHSVVRGSDGALFDVTPSRASQPYPFIDHPPGAPNFEQILAEHNLGSLEVGPFEKSG